MADGAVDDDIARIRVPYDITINAVVLRVFHDGSAGTLEVDVQGDGGGGYATILGANITLASGGGDDSEATAGSIVTSDFDTGDTLRLDIKSIQTDSALAAVYINHTVR